MFQIYKTFQFISHTSYCKSCIFFYTDSKPAKYMLPPTLYTHTLFCANQDHVKYVVGPSLCTVEGTGVLNHFCVNKSCYIALTE